MTSINPDTPVKDSPPGIPAVQACPADLARRFERSGAAAGFRVELFGEIEQCPLFGLTKRAAGPRPRVYLSAGIHGDEPAPPLALLSLIEQGAFDGRATWFMCPLLNPAGLARGTRENAGGLDLNRGYREAQALEIQAHVGWLRRQPNFDLTLCLHEDWESKGFYLYELDTAGRASCADGILRAVAPVCPVDPSEAIDGRPARSGIIRPSGDPQLRERWPESIYLRTHHHSGLHYTLESPSAFPIDQRVRALGMAVQAALSLALR